MSKLQELKNLKGKELLKFLYDNKKELIAEKKAMVKHSDALTANVSFVYEKENGVIKSEGEKPAVDDNGQLHVTMVCNATLFCDAHMDVGIPGCYTKTVKERGKYIPHIADHNHKIAARVGKTIDTYVANIAYSRLGISGDGTLECLVQESHVMKEYDPKVYLMYKEKQVTQHSIALVYIKLSLAINDSDYKEEFAVWNKYYSEIINKDVVDQWGFFWAMEEIKVYENSAVLFGANELTPTIDTKGSTSDQPPKSTESEPPTPGKSIDFKSIIQSLKN